MPTIPRNYQPIPYASQPRYVPNYGTLGELMGLRARNTAQGWAQLANVFNNFVETRQQQQDATAAAAQRQQREDAELQLKRDEMAARKAERDEAQRLRNEAQQEKEQLAAEKRGDARAKSIGYGPINETDVDTVMQSPERAGDVRYSFGPGTAEGPELQPTRDQQALIDARTQVEKLGGIMGPNGSIHMPPKPPAPDKPPAIGSFEDYVVRKFGPQPTPEQIEQARQRYAAEARAPQAPKSNDARIDRIGNNFRVEPVVKKAQTMAEAVDFVNGLNPNTTNPADDQALIYAFAKAMDPESVVREGEYATVQKYAQSWANTLGFNTARLFSNSPFLTPEARKNMKATIQARFEPVRKQYNNLHTSYAKRLSEITGEDGAGFLNDYGKAFPEPVAAPSVKLGQVVTVKGQRLRVTKINKDGTYEGVAVK